MNDTLASKNVDLCYLNTLYKAPTDSRLCLYVWAVACHFGKSSDNTNALLGSTTEQVSVTGVDAPDLWLGKTQFESHSLP